MWAGADSDAVFFACTGVGDKRARTDGIEDVSQHKPPGMSNEQYLNELLAEHEKHKTLSGDAKFPHSNRLLVAEIERVTAGSEALAQNANWKLHEVCFILQKEAFFCISCRYSDEGGCFS